MDHVPSRAVVLAGGFGKRLAPYTTVFPKPLMPIQGRPVLELVLRRLRVQGVTRVTLAVSYLEELIRAFFGDGSKLGLDIDYYREETMLGTAGVLAQLPDLPDPCIVMNGDVLTTVDLAAVVEEHRRHDAVMTVVTQPRRVDIDYGVLDLTMDGLIAGYREKPSLEYVVSAGVNVVSRTARDAIRPNERCDIPTLVGRLLAAGHRVAAYRDATYWRDIGRAEDYQAADREFPEIQHHFGL